MMTRKAPFSFDGVEHNALLLVEGINDARFFDAYLNRELGVADVQIAQVGGNTGFRPFLAEGLPNARGVANVRRLGIVTDADTDAAAAFQRIRSALADAGFPAPRRVWETAQSHSLSVAVAVLPDGSAPGDLETLCMSSIADSPLSVCVDEYLACARAAGREIAAPNKARLHAYLAAAGRRPGLRLGEAAAAGVWDWTAPAFNQIRRFLLDLAGG